MHLASLNITDYKNFHSDFEINFSKNLNVLVGENGVGKSAIIDALRLLLLEDEFGRNLISEAAFHAPFDGLRKSASFFEIRGTFASLTKEQVVAFLPWTDGAEGASLTLHVENRQTARGQFKSAHWGGASRASAFERELFDAIDCIYLPPLRDAEAKLREGRGSRLARLLRTLNAKELEAAQAAGELHPLEAKVDEFNKSLAQESSIDRANELIQKRLKDAIGNIFGQRTLIQYSQTNFTRIVERLRLLFYPELTVDASSELFRSLDQNSMGYNNLLYLATVLAELDTEAEETQYLKLLLIEEPEAHLHPQLQTKLLKYLEAKAIEDNVQIILTTHSPVLASAVSVGSLIHLSGCGAPRSAPGSDLVAVSCDQRHS